MTLPHDRLGSGDPLLLLHPTGPGRGVWGPVRDALAAQRDVIVPDLPGFGEAPPLAGDPNPAALAGAVAGLLDELGLDRVDAAGNSLGGWVSLELAKLGRARSVTALSPSGFFNEREARYLELSLLLTRRSAIALRRVAPLVFATAVGRALTGGQMQYRPWRMPAADMVAAMAVVADSPGFVAVSRAQTTRRFEGGESIDVPVTIAWAEHDRLLIPRQANRARRALPQARHITLTGCGHIPFFDDPEQVARVILEGSAG